MSLLLLGLGLYTLALVILALALRAAGIPDDLGLDPIRRIPPKGW